MRRFTNMIIIGFAVLQLKYDDLNILSPGISLRPSLFL